MTKLLVRIFGLLGLLKYFNLIASIKMHNGVKVIFPVIQGLGRENLSQHEPWMDRLLEKILSLKDGVFIDVGVNMGQTMVKVKSIKPETEYLGFEPNPICVFYAKELSRANHFSKIQIAPVGLSENNSLLELYFYTDNDVDSSASVVCNFRPEKIYRKEYVPCFSFDALSSMTDSKSFSVVKIDVEGAELLVLRGMSLMIKKNRPIILVEILPVYSLENTERFGRQKEIEELTRQWGYKILRVMKTNEHFDHFYQIQEFGLTTQVGESDYLLCPEETVDKIVR